MTTYQPYDSKFKNASGAFLTKALFFETTLEDKTGVLFTLKQEDYLGYPSLYRLYMETDDPTEYKFATLHLGGVKHWEMLQECTWLSPLIARWRSELELRLRANALNNIRSIADEPNHKAALAANRFLLESPWKATDGKRAGRPTKDAIKQEAARQASQARGEALDINADYDRLIGTRQ